MSGILTLLLCASLIGKTISNKHLYQPVIKDIADELDAYDEELGSDTGELNFPQTVKIKSFLIINQFSVLFKMLTLPPPGKCPFW